MPVVRLRPRHWVNAGFPDTRRLNILYQDADLIAVDKPAGLLVHRTAIDRHETRFAMQMLRNQTGRRVYPVHRLDKPTSGVLLFAWTPQTARKLGDAFTTKQVSKTYLAVVRGYTETKGEIDYPLKEQLDKMTDHNTRHDKAAQPALTTYRRLATIELPVAVDRYASSRYSLVEIVPRTGRKHQIRRHMKHIFHPIIGDTTHGQGKHNRFFQERFRNNRLLLAATELCFPHPSTHIALRIVAPLADSFTSVIDRLGWREALPARWFGFVANGQQDNPRRLIHTAREGV